VTNPTVDTDAIKFDFCCALDEFPSPHTVAIYAWAYPQLADWFRLHWALETAPPLPPWTEAEQARLVEVGMRAFRRTIGQDVPRDQ